MSVRTATRLFLGHAQDDRGFAPLLADRLDRAGLDVEAFSSHGDDVGFAAELRTALTGADQVAFLVTRQFATSDDLAIGVGAARMAGRPVYILYDGMAESDVPAYLRRFPLYRVDEISQFVDETSRTA